MNLTTYTKNSNNTLIKICTQKKYIICELHIFHRKKTELKKHELFLHTKQKNFINIYELCNNRKFSQNADILIKFIQSNNCTVDYNLCIHNVRLEK